MSDDKNISKLSWFKEGLRFKCTECGKCCTGGPGVINIQEEEIEKAAQYLNMSVSNFKKIYVKNRDNQNQLIQIRSQNYDCVFLKDKKCGIYPVRPSQCRTFPWWKENLNSEESWKEAAKECEGINNQASVVPYEDILKQIQ